MIIRLATLLLALAVLAAPPAAEAQPAGRVPRIGILSMAPTVETPVFDTFRKALRELGYVEQSTIVLEFRLSHGQADRLSTLADELVRAKVDVIVTDGGPPTQAAFTATKDIPIVVGAGGANPVERGWAKSLARPGGNLTGITTSEVDLIGKQLEILKDMLPRVSRVAVLYNPGSSRMVRDRTRAAARSLRLHVDFVEVPSPDSVPHAFESIARGRGEAVFVVADRMLYDVRAQIAKLAIQYQGSPSWVKMHSPRPAHCCPTARAFLTCSVGPRATRTRFSKAQTRVISQSSNPRSSTW